MIDCKNVSVKIQGKTILHNVSCHIPEGLFTAIIGRNGSGKTTLANCICKQIKYAGKIYVDSTDIDLLSGNALSKKLAYLPQNLPEPSVTVEELVSFGRMPHIGFQKKLTTDDKNAIASAICKTEMQNLSYRAIADISGGERQKAFLAMTLAQETNILILDEPNTFMDAAAQLQFLKLLRDLTASGKTVVAILHDLSLAAEFADHIIILDSGICVFSDSKEICLQQQQIEKRFHVNRYDAQNEGLSQIFFR